MNNLLKIKITERNIIDAARIDASVCFYNAKLNPKYIGSLFFFKKDFPYCTPVKLHSKQLLNDYINYPFVLLDLNYYNNITIEEQRLFLEISYSGGNKIPDQYKKYLLKFLFRGEICYQFVTPTFHHILKQNDFISETHLVFPYEIVNVNI